MGVKTTSDRFRSCGTIPILGGHLYQEVLVRVGQGTQLLVVNSSGLTVCPMFFVGVGEGGSHLEDEKRRLVLTLG